jgi:hypothetical protein
MKLNNHQVGVFLVLGIGFFFALKDEECRVPYVQGVLPAALMACVQTDDTKPPSDSEKK